MEGEGHGNLTARESPGDAIELNQGKCRIQCFGVWPILEPKKSDYLGLCSSVLTINSIICLSQVPQLHESVILNRWSTPLMCTTDGRCKTTEKDVCMQEKPVIAERGKSAWKSNYKCCSYGHAKFNEVSSEARNETFSIMPSRANSWSCSTDQPVIGARVILWGNGKFSFSG